MTSWIVPLFLLNVKESRDILVFLIAPLFRFSVAYIDVYVWLDCVLWWCIEIDSLIKVKRVQLCCGRSRIGTMLSILFYDVSIISEFSPI